MLEPGAEDALDHETLLRAGREPPALRPALPPARALGPGAAGRTGLGRRRRLRPVLPRPALGAAAARDHRPAARPRRPGAGPPARPLATVVGGLRRRGSRGRARRARREGAPRARRRRGHRRPGPGAAGRRRARPVDPEPAPAWHPALEPGADRPRRRGALGERAGTRPGPSTTCVGWSPGRSAWPSRWARSSAGRSAPASATSPATRCAAAGRPRARRSPGPVSQSRRFATLRVPLADLQAVHAAHGHTVNDVVLAVVAGGLRSWLLDPRRAPRLATGRCVRWCR